MILPDKSFAGGDLNAVCGGSNVDTVKEGEKEK